MEKATQAPPTFAEKVSKAVWAILKPELPTDSPLVKAPPLLDVDKKKLQTYHNSRGFSDLMELYLRRSYTDEGVQLDRLLRLHLENIVKKVDEILDEEPEARAHREKLMRFKPFVGDADVRFLRHLLRCCKLYLADPSAYVAPWLVLTQSSGFGKTRLVYEVASKLASGAVEELPEGDALDVRLLYVSTRDMEPPYRYLLGRPNLVKFFFRECRIADELAFAVEYACGKWEEVKRDWLGLFGADFENEREADYMALNEVPSDHQCWRDGVTEDRLYTGLRSTRGTYSGSLRIPIPEDENARVKVLVLVIDKASCVLEEKDKHGVSRLQLLCRALNHVNREVRDRKVLVFAVLVDTNPQIADVASELRSFPPFVLTHTMDIMLSQPCSERVAPFDYKTSVLEDDPDKVWDVLVSMGRPLWRNYTSAMTAAVPRALEAAGRKLIGGLELTDGRKYEKTRGLQGVASMLCRLGLRPQSSSTFSAQAVTHLMAVLHYVSDTRDARVCGYVTEPVLTFGATHLWYTEQSLEKFVLPQFREMLMRGLLEIGNVGEVAARIVLLLAMDEACRMDGAQLGFFHDGELFRGQFGSVKRLMGLLDGSQDKDIELFNVVGDRDAATPAQRTTFESWMSDWGKWSVGFSHFVEFTRLPTEATLWFLLGRRAAGVLPREQEGADLIVPIFCKSTATSAEVSFILVKVYSQDDVDADFLPSALAHLTPASVFEAEGDTGDKHELAQWAPRQMLRILMSLREESDVSKPAQSYLIDRDEATKQESYTLRLRGVCDSPLQGSKASVDSWSFLQSEKVSDLLADIAASTYWDPTEMIQKDLASTAEEMPREEAEEGVGFTMQSVPYEC